MEFSGFNHKKILLASKSPRRSYLLKEAGIDFELVDVGDPDESFPKDMHPESVPLFLSEMKSFAYKNQLNENEILLSSDTIVLLDNEVIGKPLGQSDAEKMLAKLSGKKHTVISGVCLRSMKKLKTFSAKTDVYFKPLSAEEINFYIENFKPFDKAGAYGIQEWIGYIGIERIEGSYFNVMGLPIQRLYVELIEFIKTE